MRPNQKTRQVHVGNVALGGGAPVVVQSMLNAPADDAQANLAQIQQLADAGCEVVRMAIPRRSCLDTFQAVCEESPLPVVADVHFDATIAIEAARRGAAKLRINPGNIGGLAKTDAVLDAAGQAGIPIRIGVNAGSLDLRRRNPELISCPTCGRCQVDLIGLAQEVERRIACLDKPVKVAVMGCVVNGPGEAADADIGVACGKGVGVVFRHGQTVRKVEEGAIVDALLEEIKDL